VVLLCNTCHCIDLFWMQTINKEDLTEITPMLSTNAIQIYVYIEVGASLCGGDILLTCT
jgi:hypothetical protein